jgi:hypothetical protein
MRYRFSNVRTTAGLQTTLTDEGAALLGPISITCDWESEYHRVMSVTIEVTNTQKRPRSQSLHPCCNQA